MARSIPDTIRAGVARAKDRLDHAMTTVQHLPTIGRDQHGALHGDPIDLKALVEDIGVAVVGRDGQEQMSTAKLTILESVTVQTSDKFVVNGEELNVAKRAGLLDPDGVPYFVEVWLGRGQFV